MPKFPLNTIILGDCLEKMKDIPDGSIDCIICDLPYGTTSNKWDSIVPLDELWSAWKRICKAGSPIVLFTQQPFTTTVAASNLKQLKTEWIWEKPQGTGFLNANIYPLKNHENILTFCDRTPPYYPQKSVGSKPYVANRDKDGRNSPNYRPFGKTKTINTDGTRFPKTILKYKADKGLHPTQKPVELLEYLIRTYTKEGQVILDCCCGSGSLAVAALNTDRQFICIEKNETYHAIAEKRIAERLLSDTALALNEIPSLLDFGAHPVVTDDF